MGISGPAEARPGRAARRWAPFLVVALLVSCPASAQLYHFGQNKVQFDEFEWQRLETEHFDLYFYAEEAELAAYAGRMAEDGFRQLEQRLGFTVRRRVPLILYASHVHFEQTNVIPGLLPEGVAGFTEFLKGRVVLPLSGSFPEFERVLHHELVHVFMFDRIRAVLAARGQPDVWFGPLWFSEGLAEYLSSTWDSYGDMILRDALFSGRLLPLAEIYRINGSFQLYKEGQSAVGYMAQRYGEDFFGRLLDNWWRANTFAGVFRATTGDDLAELDTDWTYSLRKRYLPTIEGADPPSQMAQAMTHAGFNLKPAVVPGDSLSFVFFRNEKGYTTIARQALRPDAEPEVVAAGERATDIESLHPLQTRPAVSPDGRRLAFVAKRNGRDHLELWDLEGSRRERRYTFDDLVALASPTFSPDGTRLALSGARRSGRTDLFVVDLASGALTGLTDDLYDDRDPDWHPSENLLVFGSDRATGPGRGGKQGLYLLRVDDSGPGPVAVPTLLTAAANDQQPAWSPAGDRIAFVSDRDGFLDIYQLELDTLGSTPRIGALTRLTHSLTGVFDPAWVPGGHDLLFTGYEAGRFQIYRTTVGPADTVSTDTAAVDTGWSLAALADAGRVRRRHYRRRMSVDVAQSQISQDPIFGTSGGIQVGLSDVLGNDRYYFILSHVSGSETGVLNGLNFVLGRLYLARQLNVGWGVFRLNDRLSSSFGRFVRERRTGGWVELSYPFGRHDRVETRFTARQSDIDRTFEGRPLSGWLLSNHVSFTHDSSLWQSTGPLEGTRYSLGMGHTFDVKRSRPFHTTWFADYRHYLRLGRRSAFAVRYLGIHSRGEVPELFALGGSWTLRGYPFRSLWGRNLVLINHELRFPLLDRFILDFPFGRIDLNALRGALFVDAGNAWVDEFGDWKGSFGAGARFGLGGVFVFRLDAARRTDFRAVDNNTRWDFFFGWDF